MPIIFDYIYDVLPMSYDQTVIFYVLYTMLISITDNYILKQYN